MTKGCPGCNRQIKDYQTYCVYGCSQVAYYENKRRRERERQRQMERMRERERSRVPPVFVYLGSGGGGGGGGGYNRGHGLITKGHRIQSSADPPPP
ncbi:hypothetical protein CABS01_06291 [Colletotrichum abscissum]|uniref:uncharacterized protein n=1 Tax=Colletotrichum abscissum TaxID=1671311 RepID=UPI0027D53CE0|nr:uncharacterized protein CABS01_06291 [Colletotrichum abscissum]KAK1516324.1 hypothetical protein CABS01_06291 [Colletotrichum abscissum]